jgi:hypothetical protein
MLLRMISRRNEQKMREPAETLVPPGGGCLRLAMVWKGGIQRRYLQRDMTLASLPKPVGLGLFILGDI